ncbi:hypothetical protein HC891_16035 [Candidatus Gracilibacteria bacterium]|nr:hypothetical protein [Candidatus Gracilibacteria bacterium]
MIDTENFLQVEVTAVHQLRAWLTANHTQQESIWLVTYKKHCADRYVSRSDVLDELLCFGWIDGVRRKLDLDRTMQLVGPRRTHHWAQSYKGRVAHLEHAGRMHPAGRAAIAAAQRTGLWDADADVDALLMPEDLVAALVAHPPAHEQFAQFAISYRRNVLRWITRAKTPATRAKRIAQTALLAAKHEKVPQL